MELFSIRIQRTFQLVSTIMTLLFGVKIGFSGEKKALPVGFSGKARYLQASMHISYKKWLSGCCRD